MDSYGVKMKGDLKTDNVRSIDGVLSIEIANTTGDVTFKDDFAMEGGSPSEGKILRAADSTGLLEWGSALPSGIILLIRSNTAITGFTLLTSINDFVVYITKGSAAGGEEAGTSKSGGTWTQPNHTHTTSGHTLTEDEMPAHTHTQTITENDGTKTSCVVGSDYTQSSGTSLTTTSTGGGNSHNHGDTGGSNTISDWRPAGINYTRQQKD